MSKKTIIGYTLLHPLGEGGMAEVWYAENSIGKKAAVKILKEEFTKMASVQERFKNEAQVMVTLSHPHIRQVYDYGSIDSRPCIVMEYLNGADLSTRLKQGEHFSDSQLSCWWDNMVDILRYTHRQGVVHRDIKPSNIFITDAGELKLLDFGIAKIKGSLTLTQTGSRMGTLMYMSPEQVRDSKHLDHRSDFYSLAVTFYHLVSGKAPYDNQTDSEFDIQMKIVSESLDATSLPLSWQKLLAPLLAKNADERVHPQKWGEVSETNAGDATTVAQPQLEATQGKTTRVSDATTVAQTKPKPSVASPIGERDDSKPQPRRKWIFIALGILLAVVIILVVKQVAGNESTPLNSDGTEQLGNDSIPLNADGTEEFTENLVPKYLGGKFGFIDKSGREVIPFKYDWAGSFSEGLALVELGGKWGFIDTSGREVTPIKYDYVGGFSEGLALVKLGGKWGFIDKSGRVVISIKYDDVGSFSEGLARVKLGDKYGFIDKSGREVISIKYDDVGSFSEGLARVKLGGKFGFIDKSGRVVISIKYDDVGSFSEGLARVELGGKYGFIDESGRVVIPIKYDWAGDFSKGLVVVKLGGKSDFIDKSGRKVILTISDLLRG